jgi:putative ABC transport system substrate-binding protein
MKRREFITLLGSAAVAWPLAARAQQDRMRRIGVLMHLAADDPEGQARHATFLQGLQQSGWSAGRNVRIDTRWGASEADRRRYAAELVALAPDVILASNSQATLALQAATSTVPIVFANVTDPVAAGFVDSLARPGGNATGFTLFEYGISAKWLELLKEIAPGVTRAAVIREGTNPAGIGQFAAIQSVAPSHGVQVSSVVVRDGSEIERAVDTLARSPNNSGLIVTASGLRDSDGHLIVTLAARYRLPAVYPFPSFVTDGGLICYGPSSTDSRAKSHPNCRSRRRTNMSWWSISKPRRRSVSTCQRRFWRAPTR